MSSKRSYVSGGGCNTDVHGSASSTGRDPAINSVTAQVMPLCHGRHGAWCTHQAAAQSVDVENREHACSRLTRIVASRKCATLAMLRTIWKVVELSSPVWR